MIFLKPFVYAPDEQAGGSLDKAAHGGKTDDDKPTNALGSVLAGHAGQLREQAEHGIKQAADLAKDQLTKARATAESVGQKVGDNFAQIKDKVATDLQPQLQNLETNFKELIERIDLTDPKTTISNAQTAVTDLAKQIGTLRERGYTYAKSLDLSPEAVRKNLADAQTQVTQFVEQNTPPLLEKLDDAAQKVRELRLPNVNFNDVVTQVNGLLTPVEKTIKDAEGNISKLTDAVQTELSKASQLLFAANFALQQKDEASFAFAADESVFRATRAEWDNGADKPDGILFLTNKRVLFEQKEEVGGGFFRKGEHKQELLWELSISAITDVQNEDKGLFGSKDFVHITSADKRYTVEVKGGVDSKVWRDYIASVKDGSAE
jgi:uncharacterized protein YktB (UPF0637 family)